MKTTHSEKVGFFVPGWPLDACPNGIVSYVTALRTGLTPLGVDSLVFVPRQGRHGEKDVVDVEVKRSTIDRVRGLILRGLGYPESHFTDFDRALRREVARLDREGLCVFEMEEFFGLIDHFRVPGVTRVARLHGPWFLNGEALGVTKDVEFEKRVQAEGMAIRNADAVSSPSADVLNRVRKFYGLELPHARVVPNPAGRVTADRIWRFENCRPNQILFVGRFDRHKGGDVVLDAFAKIAASFPQVELVFAGPDRGFETDNGRQYTLDDYVKERIPDSYRPRVHLLGHTSPERIEELRRESFVCIVASRYETFSMTTIEGLAQGCPMVAARVGGIPEIVTHERTGLLFHPGDPTDLSEKVMRLLSRPDEARQYAAAARREYEARFNPDVVAKAMLDFYLSIPGCQLNRQPG